MPDMHTLSVIRQDWMRSIRGFDGLDMLHHMYFCVSLQSTSCLIDDGIQRNGWSRNVQKGPSVHSWLCIAFFSSDAGDPSPKKTVAIPPCTLRAGLHSARSESKADLCTVLQALHTAQSRAHPSASLSVMLPPSVSFCTSSHFHGL